MWQRSKLASAAVDGDLDRHGVQHLTLGRGNGPPRAIKQKVEVGLAHGTAMQRAVHPHIGRLGPASADCQHDLPQSLTGALLGLVDRRQYRALGSLGVNDLAGLEAIGEMVAAAQQMHALAWARARDVAADLARAHVEDAERVSPAPGAFTDKATPCGCGSHGHARGSLP
jgi:hypothetical protein